MSFWFGYEIGFRLDSGLNHQRCLAARFMQQVARRLLVHRVVYLLQVQTIIMHDIARCKQSSKQNIQVHPLCCCEKQKLHNPAVLQ